MHRESHATVDAWRTSMGWGETRRVNDSAVESERGEAAEEAIPRLVEEPDHDEETRSVTPDLLAHFDSTIKQLRSDIAALRTGLEEEKIAAEHKQAQMVTLNMALNGAPREEAERYLSQNFRLADAGPILDDAYGRDTS